MDITKIEKAAEIAKARTNDKRRINAIDKTVAGIVSGWWIVTELADCVTVTTEGGKTYFADSEACQCRAFELGQPCKHRSIARLIEIAGEIKETVPEAVSSDKIATKGATRDAIISEIKNVWTAKCPNVSLADELMAHFRRNLLEMLSIDFLTAIRAAIAQPTKGAPLTTTSDTRKRSKPMPSDCLETQVWYTKDLDVFNILDYEKKPVKDKDWVFNRRTNDRGYIERYYGQRYLAVARFLNFYKLISSEQQRHEKQREKKRKRDRNPFPREFAC